MKKTETNPCPYGAYFPAWREQLSKQNSKFTEQKVIKWSGRKTQEGKIAQDKGL